MAILSYLKSIGLPVNPLAKQINSIEDMTKYHKTLESEREHIPYEIDGSVIKVDNYSLRSTLGERARSPRWAIAAKFKSKSAETQILDIILQVGRTGVITPVAKIKEVEISGAMISSATLHNQDEIDKKDIRINDYAIVQRSGDVIPKISKIILKKRPKNTVTFNIASHNCPSCQSIISRIEGEVAYRCENLACNAKLQGSIEHFCSKNAMNIDGLGVQIVEQLMHNNLIQKIDDLFNLSYSDLVVLDRFQEKSANNLIKAINESKDTTFPRLVFALGIPNVGQHISKILDIHCESSIKKLSTSSLEELEAIDGVGLIVAQSIIEFFNSPSNRETIKNCLNSGVKIKKTVFRNSKELKDVTFVITGSFKNYKRNQIKELLERKGAKVTSAISSKTNFLVMGENAGSKADKAQALNIKIINENQLRSLLDEQNS